MSAMLNGYTDLQKKMVQELEATFQAGHLKSTVLDMQLEYADDPKLCFTSVVFLPRFLAEQIDKLIIQPLRAIEPYHYYYPLESLHVTIKNIRTVSKPPLFTEYDIQKVKEFFQEIVPRFSTFEYRIEDVLAFPTSAAVMGYCDMRLKSLVLALDMGLKEIGIPDDKRYISNEVFWGNVTFCRFVQKPSTDFFEALKKLRHLFVGTFFTEIISLITCNAACSPTSKRIVGEYKLKP